MSQPALIRKTPLTGRWVLITRYKTLPGNIISATTTIDITQQMELVLKEDRKQQRVKAKKKGGS